MFYWKGFRDVARVAIHETCSDQHNYKYHMCSLNHYSKYRVSIVMLNNVCLALRTQRFCAWCFPMWIELNWIAWYLIRWSQWYSHWNTEEIEAERLVYGKKSWLNHIHTPREISFCKKWYYFALWNCLFIWKIVIFKSNVLACIREGVLARGYEAKPK